MALPIGEKTFSVMRVVNAHCELEHLEELSSPSAILQTGDSIRKTITDSACFPSTFLRKDSWQNFSKALEELEREFSRAPRDDRRERSNQVYERKRLARIVQEKSKPLHYALRDEIENMPVCRISMLHFEIEKWVDVRNSFGPNGWVFDALPELAQDDLQDAAWCYLFDQFTPCVMLILRATECVCREYAKVAMPPPQLDKGETFESWNKLILRMRESHITEDPKFSEWLMLLKEKRNDFMHPSQRLRLEDEQEVEKVFGPSKSAMVVLWQDLRRRDKV